MLSDALNQLHGQILAQNSVTQDVKLAERMENFYNRIIYNKALIPAADDDNLGRILDSIMTEELAQEIQRTINTQTWGKGLNTSESLPKWQILEKKVGIIAQKVVNKAFGTKAQLKTITTGTNMSYVDLSKIPEEFKEDFFNHISQVQDGNITRTQARQGKNDVYVYANLKDNVSQELQLLQSLSFSVKNYSGTIKLEAVNPLKGYLAIMQHYKTYLPKGFDLYNAYRKYYITNESEADETVTAHLNHILNIYALTGLGNFNLNTGEPDKAVRFLLVNTGSNIRIYSTAAIIKDLLNEKGPSSFVFGKKKLNSKRSKYKMITVKKI